MHIWNQLTLTAEQQRGYYKMVGNTTQLTFITDPSFAAVDGPCSSSAPHQVCAPRNALPETTLYVPLQFWYCRNPGLALPLIALQYHEIKINLDLRPIDECLWAVNNLGTGATTPGKVSTAYQQSLVAASLYVDYVFLDTDERRRMAQNPHEYLIEQLQFTGDESVGSSSNKIKLNFNHHAKNLSGLYSQMPMLTIAHHSLKGAISSQSLVLSHSITLMPSMFFQMPVHSFGGPEAVAGGNEAFITASGLFEQAGAADDIVSDGWNYTAPNFSVSGGLASGDVGTIAQSSVSDAGTFVLTETSLDMHCWGENPVVTAKLQLNGQDRFSEREGTYFDLVQPFQHHTRSPDTGINVYSFALRPEEHQPSGTCNFSRIDNATLQLVLSNATVGGTNTAKVRVYATNYNVLRIMSGMGGLAYSN